MRNVKFLHRPFNVPKPLTGISRILKGFLIIRITCQESQTEVFCLHVGCVNCMTGGGGGGGGTAVAQWLRRCDTKVACSIAVGVSLFFIDIKSFRSHYGPGFDSASNRYEYQEYFLGVKAAGA